jgi:hypothetical protein
MAKRARDVQKLIARANEAAGVDPVARLGLAEKYGVWPNPRRLRWFHEVDEK